MTAALIILAIWTAAAIAVGILVGTNDNFPK